MTLQQRVDYLTYVFDLLQSTSSRTEKELIVKDIDADYKEDFDYVLECLAGKHKFGYTYYKTIPIINDNVFNFTVKDVLKFLQTPMETGDLSVANIKIYVAMTNAWYDFLAPIVNRTLRLGIGESLLEKPSTAPMLAKKFEGYAEYDKQGYFITEKLDGNRCIAHFENGQWNFTSRNGKKMHVNFDMSGMDTRYIYDGEVLSPAQVAMSNCIENKVKYNINPNTYFKDEFSNTSGLINRHSTDKKLIYNIFDIMCDVSYKERREELDRIEPEGNDVKILPVLKYYKSYEELQDCWGVLNNITDIGGEGLMINLASAKYNHKRTSDLLKLKKVYTMDMRVVDIIEGTGKYEGEVGSLQAIAKTDDGKFIRCNVGTGLDDEQRALWSVHPELIKNATIEVSYFSLSQTKEDRERGEHTYSLRFPRLKRVRYDKDETSEY